MGYFDLDKILPRYFFYNDCSVCLRLLCPYLRHTRTILCSCNREFDMARVWCWYADGLENGAHEGGVNSAKAGMEIQPPAALNVFYMKN